MSSPDEKNNDPSAAFQKIWLESMSKVMQAAFAATPDAAPPELLRQIRAGIFEALAGSWNEFLRSPQFQENMRQWMEQAITFRKLSNDFMAKVRKEMQAPSRDDIDAVMLAVRHMETRVLDRVEKLAKQVEELERRSSPSPVAKPAPAPSSPDSRASSGPRTKARPPGRTGKR